MFWPSRVETLARRLRAHDIPLRITLWDGRSFDLGSDPAVTILAPSPAGLRHLVRPSLDALGRAYVEGRLEVEGEVARVIEVVARLAHHTVRPAGPFGPWLRRARHTRQRDAEAVSYHYDLSNHFYSLWLDRDMVYSCGYFRSPEDSLEDAQVQKIDHILKKIRLRPGDRLLDIGCGWGALILRAAARYGAVATGITLSRKQWELARERIAAAGLADRCQVLLADYRDMKGSFDRITSVGMFEHVGLDNLPVYFKKIRDLLADGGVAMNHGITATDVDSGEVSLGAGEFIERYVFPLGELPHLSLALREMCAAGLEPVDVESLRPHYVRTLRHWSRRFEAAADAIRAEVGEKPYRIWRMYLAGCAYAFEHNWTSIHQILAVKAGGPGANPLPATRDYMYC
ncbi:MAG TPA: class I SAM-dependent methyltransferase [Rhodocyclaceae bacterium]|nr:class I SAM-dependent methyltransferase [Rhodocyclaceae bacterium]